MTAFAIIGAAFGIGYALLNVSPRMSPLSIGELLWWGDAETLALIEARKGGDGETRLHAKHESRFPAPKEVQ